MNYKVICIINYTDNDTAKRKRMMSNKFDEIIPADADRRLIQTTLSFAVKSDDYHLNALLCVVAGEEKPYGVVDNCDQCEFCMEADAGPAIGAMLMSRGNYQYCEKGYWKEDT